MFDAPRLRFLGRMAPASSARDGASALRDGGPGAVARSSQLCAFHSFHHPSCPHRCCGGQRNPHSSTAFAGATRHFSCFPFCTSLSVQPLLSARPCRPADQKAGKVANQEADTHCCPQTPKNMTGSLVESKIYPSQHNIGLNSHHHFDNWIFLPLYFFTT